MRHCEIVTQAIEALLRYKKGKCNLKQTVTVFSSLTGISPEIAEKYIANLKRDNVCQLLDELPNN